MKRNLVIAAIRAKVLEVHFGGWNLIRDLRNLKLEPKSSEWLNYKNKSELWEAPDYQQESTYQDCISATYNLKTSILVLTMHDGDSVDGFPTFPRCKWEFVIEPSTDFFKKTVAPKIERRMEMRAEEIFQTREDKRIKDAIAAILQELYK